MFPQAAIFDIDETLTPSGEPVPRDVAALLVRLGERMPVAVMTGRDLGHINTDFLDAMQHSEYPERFFVFVNSASQCFAASSSGWLCEYEEGISPEEREAAHQAIQEARDVLPILQGATAAECIDTETGIKLALAGADASYEMRRAWDPTYETRSDIIQYLSTRLPGLDLRIGGAATIDITRTGITKAFGVEWLARRLGIAPAHMLYVGDALFPQGNDEVVVRTGIHTRRVYSPSESTGIIESLCRGVIV